MLYLKKEKGGNFMELLKEIWAANPPAAFAVICLIGYFWGMAVVLYQSL